MRELFQLSHEDVVELLGVIKTGVFNHRHAAYWQCTVNLLESAVYRKIEVAVEEELRRPVYFIFDELFTPFAGLNFEAWHKDAEDACFDEGCRNVWIPLYSSGEEVGGLETLANHELNAFDFALEHRAPQLPFPINDAETLFINRSHESDQGRRQMKVVPTRELMISAPPAKLNTVYLLNSSQFHRARLYGGFQIRFGIKFALQPLARLPHPTVQDMTLFAYAMDFLERESGGFRELSPRAKCYSAGKFVHERFARDLNDATFHHGILYHALLDSLCPRG